MISGRETPLSSTVSCMVVENVFNCGFILGMSMDTFGILLGNVIYAVYIGVLADKDSDLCTDDNKKLKKDNTSGTVSH